MAKYSDIVKSVEERATSPFLSPGLTTRVYDIEAPTDQLAADSLIAQYPVDFEDEKKSGKEFFLPDIQSIATLVGEKNDGEGGKTAAQKFVDNFPKKLKEYKEIITDDPRLGQRGWETVKRMWQDASNAQMLQNIDKARKDAVDGEGLQKVGSTIMKIFTPRRYEAITRGDEPTWQDTLGDFAENSLYMVPGGTWVNGAKALARGVRAGRAAQALAKATPSMIIGSAAAPLGIELIDSGTRGDEDPNISRRDFSFGDVINGTGTNAVVNYQLRRMLSPIAMATMGGNGGARGKVRQIIEKIGKSDYERGRSALEKAKVDATLPQVEAGQLSPEVLNGGVGAVRSIPAAAGQQAKDFIKFSEIVDNLNYLPEMSKGETSARVAEFLANDKEAEALVKRVLDGPLATDAMNLLRSSKLTPRQLFRDVAQQGVGAWGVNKYGGQREADLALGMLDAPMNATKGTIKKVIGDEHKEAENKQKAKRISEVLKGADISDLENQYIEAIKQNPEILKTGYRTKDDPEGTQFKMWLLTRGNRLLMPSGVIRPTWDVK